MGVKLRSSGWHMIGSGSAGVLGALSIAFGSVAPAQAASPDPAACLHFLRTNPDVLRTVDAYAHGSARNPRMNIEETVSFVAGTITESVRNSTPSNRFTPQAALFYNCLSHITRADIQNLWPNLNAVIAEKEKREAVEAEKQFRQCEAEQQQEQDKLRTKMEQSRKQTAIDALPSNRLLKSYRLYIGVKQCFEARNGYAAVYLSGQQMGDAKSRVVAIEKALKAADPTIDSDAVWSKANAPEPSEKAATEFGAVLQFADALGKRWVSSPEWIEEANDYCKRTFSALSDQYSEIVPGANVVRKDF